MASNVVLISGGIDSATLAASLADEGGARGIFVDYGQSASADEERAARAVAAHLGMRIQVLRLEGLRFSSGEIRGRNAFLLHSALLSLPPRPVVLLIGIHAGTPYVDCGEEFLDVHRRSFDLHTGGEVQITAPFAGMTKGDIFELAQQLDVPLQLTYSCEHGGTPCGQCLSCLDRAHLRAIA